MKSTSGRWSPRVEDLLGDPAERRPDLGLGDLPPGHRLQHLGDLVVLSTVEMPLTALASSLVTRSAASGLARYAPIFEPTEKPASRSRTTSSDRKLVATNSDSDEPMASLRVGMIAVCGIGSPSGLPEQRRDREPVGERTDHPGLGRRPHVPEPRDTGPAEQPGDHEDHRHQRPAWTSR